MNLKKVVGKSYTKIYRIKTPHTAYRGKKYLDPSEVHILLNSYVTVEEKLDGKTHAIQVDDCIYFGENLKETHTIYYKNLPDEIVFFDVKKNERYLKPKEKVIKILEIGGVPTPIIYSGHLRTLKKLESLLFNTQSAFNTEINPKMKKMLDSHMQKNNFIEGLVVKLYGNRVIFGKIVNPIFERIIDKVGSYKNYPYKNRIAFWSFKEYSNYLKNNVLNKLDFYIPEESLQIYYEKYVETWRKKLKFGYLL